MKAGGELEGVEIVAINDAILSALIVYCKTDTAERSPWERMASKASSMLYLILVLYVD